ncbi:MAG: tyrosine recombinase XerC, partial [Candidatus Hodarchaeota archaeon]
IMPGEEVVVADRMPTKEELKQILNIGSLRDRTMILILSSSGLRIGALATLKLGDIELDEEIPRVIVKRKPGRKISKRMKGFATFITPEAKNVLLQYIRHRESLGEKISEASPIITSERQEELGNFLNSVYLSNHWRRLLKRAHLATKNGGPWHDIHLHTLRKYFETQCTNAAVKTTYREFWMGHTGRYLEESYFRGEVVSHIEEYKKAILYLTILAPEPQDYKVLVEKVKFLEENGKRKDARAQAQEMEIQKLRNQLDEHASLITIVEKLGREVQELKRKIKET